MTVNVYLCVLGHYQVEDGRGPGGRVDMAAEWPCSRHFFLSFLLSNGVWNAHTQRHLLTTWTLPDADTHACAQWSDNVCDSVWLSVVVTQVCLPSLKS